MQGQWQGYFRGKNSGFAVLDLDDCGDHFEGHVVAWNDKLLPAIIMPIKTKDKNLLQDLELEVIALHPESGDVLTRDQLEAIERKVAIPVSLTVRLELRARSILAKWETPIGTKGRVVLHPSAADRPSKYLPDPSITTWDEFKSYAINLEPDQHIFRGQSSTWRLRTSFHRTKRKDLLPFINKDIPALHRSLTAKTKHVFNLNNALENGAFWNLIQHHGYPTPLLDWSNSPFVAAYFAFRSKSRNTKNAANARIFMFNRKAWCKDFNQLQKVVVAKPHFSILEALAIENDRAIPQQSLSSITNVDDIESYIQLRELQQSTQYLKVIDLSFTQRDEILRELGMMGITAGSLFPGLDGACEEARNKFFGY
jgi:hypothetical protein